MTTFKTSILTLAALTLAACATETASDEFDTRGAESPRSQNHERGERQGKPNFAEAASKLGVSEDALHQAMRDAGGPPPNFDKAAAALGVSVDDLKSALPERPARR